MSTQKNAIQAVDGAGGLSHLEMRLPSIDSLRGLAATWVLFFHVWNRFYPGWSTISTPREVPGGMGWTFYLTFFLIQYGYIGVNLFFVLSGLCIHLPQAKKRYLEREVGLPVREFAQRRFWRLYPAYFASLFVTSAFLAVLPWALALTHRGSEGLLAPLQLGNLAVSVFFLQPLKPDSFFFNGVYWSLLYEVQFYAMYPVLLWAMRRAGKWPVLGVLLGIQLYLSYHPVGSMWFFPNRYFEWALGMVLAELLVHRKLSGWNAQALLCGVASVCGLAAVYSTVGGPLYAMRNVLFSAACFGVVALVLVREGEGWRGRWGLGGWFMQLGLVQVIGLFSYSLYVVHVPILDLVWKGSHLAVKYGYANELMAAVVVFGSIPVIYAFAYGFHRLFERPFMGVKKRGQGSGARGQEKETVAGNANAADFPPATGVSAPPFAADAPGEAS